MNGERGGGPGRDRVGELFERANHLWFREGRTAAAVAAYEEARRAAPDDPVIAFQLSRVLWSLDRFNEARELAARAAARRDELGTTGRRVVEDWRERIAGRPPARPFPELRPVTLDRDWLDAGPLPDGGWREVADAASARGMYGLAAYAIDRWGGVPIDADDVREIGQIETNRHLDEAVLGRMRAADERAADRRVADARGGDEGFGDEGFGDRRAGDQRVGDQRIDDERGADTPFAASAPSPFLPATPPVLPLRLDARVTPVAGRAGVESELIISLRNPTGAAQIVNERLLLNHQGAPGEVWIDVEGPPGYRNARGFRIRAGEALNEHYISLAPGHAIERAWTLTEYEALDQSGDYEITVTYHNDVPHAPDGRPLAIGQVSTIARFRRYP